MLVIERFWRTIKYEDIYLKSYTNPVELEKGVGQFVERYNADRPHQSLAWLSPNQMYEEKMKQAA
jgi:putative transposase